MRDKMSVWGINTDGVRMILFKAFIHVMDVVDQIVDEILKGDEKAVLDERYDKEIKQLIQYLALFCIGMDEDGWKEFYRIKRDLSVSVVASYTSIYGMIRRQEES